LSVWNDVFYLGRKVNCPNDSYSPFRGRERIVG
jgi:hypothetical protein